MKYEKCLTHTFRSCAPLAIRSVSEQHLFLTSLGSRFLNMRYSIVPEARQHVAWGARPCHYPHLWEVRMETSSISSPAGTSARCRVREHPVSIATHGSPPSRHPRQCRGCRLGGEGVCRCHTPGITIPGRELPSLRDSRAMPILCDGLVGNDKGASRQGSDGKPDDSRGAANLLVVAMSSKLTRTQNI